MSTQSSDYVVIESVMDGVAYSMGPMPHHNCILTQLWCWNSGMIYWPQEFFQNQEIEKSWKSLNFIQKWQKILKNRLNSKYLKIRHCLKLKHPENSSKIAYRFNFDVRIPEFRNYLLPQELMNKLNQEIWISNNRLKPKNLEKSSTNSSKNGKKSPKIGSNLRYLSI